MDTVTDVVGVFDCLDEDVSDIDLSAELDLFAEPEEVTDAVAVLVADVLDDTVIDDFSERDRTAETVAARDNFCEAEANGIPVDFEVLDALAVSDNALDGESTKDKELSIETVAEVDTDASTDDDVDFEAGDERLKAVPRDHVGEEEGDFELRGS